MEPICPRRTWLVLLPAMLIPALAALFYFVWLKDSEAAQPVYGGAKLFILVWPVAATLFILQRPLGGKHRPMDLHLRAIPLGLLIGLGIAALIAALMATPLGNLVESATGPMEEKVNSLGIQEHFILFAVCLSLFHSLLEEYYWRWFVYGNLRTVISRPAAHAIAAVGFSLHHIVVTSQFFPLHWALVFSTAVGIGGFFWSWLYQRQGTLAGAWASHAVVDAALMTVAYTMLQS
ncbi:MAG: CPBP family intramembrane metalloprotease [Verrucomicrobiales bacterium]|nr:CPBP family intramembrane metalloprotease [Verrucomicrobiales bacterium]